jgi:hypothetical protein
MLMLSRQPGQEFVFENKPTGGPLEEPVRVRFKFGRDGERHTDPRDYLVVERAVGDAAYSYLASISREKIPGMMLEVAPEVWVCSDREPNDAAALDYLDGRLAETRWLYLGIKAPRDVNVRRGEIEPHANSAVP